MQSCGEQPQPADQKPAAGERLVTYYSWSDQKNLNNIRWAAFTDAVFESVDVDPSNGLLKYTWPISTLNNFVARTWAENVNAWISVQGTWPNSTFFATIESASKQTFISQLINICLTNRLYGVNLDIEPVTDVQTYSDFVIELAENLRGAGLKLSIAADPRQLDVLPIAADDLEWINVMAYDIWYTVGYPQHSRYEDAVAAMENYVSGGIPKNKLLMGIPFYGRDGGDGFYSYISIVSKYPTASGTNSVDDPSVTGGSIWWNGPDLVAQKVKFVVGQGYYGVCVYKASLDWTHGSSLLDIIIDQLRTKSISTSLIQPSLKDNFPG